MSVTFHTMSANRFFLNYSLFVILDFALVFKFLKVLLGLRTKKPLLELLGF